MWEWLDSCEAAQLLYILWEEELIQVLGAWPKWAPLDSTSGIPPDSCWPLLVHFPDRAKDPKSELTCFPSSVLHTTFYSSHPKMYPPATPFVNLDTHRTRQHSIFWHTLMIYFQTRGGPSFQIDDLLLTLNARPLLRDAWPSRSLWPIRSFSYSTGWTPISQAPLKVGMAYSGIDSDYLFHSETYTHTDGMGCLDIETLPSWHTCIYICVHILHTCVFINVSFFICALPPGLCDGILGCILGWIIISVGTTWVFSCDICVSVTAIVNIWVAAVTLNLLMGSITVGDPPMIC